MESNKITMRYEIDFYVRQEIYFLNGTTIGKSTINEISIIQNLVATYRFVKINGFEEPFQIDEHANNCVFYTINEAIEVLKARVESMEILSKGWGS